MIALAKAQGQIADIERDRTVTVRPKTGNPYEFKYATLSAIIKGIKKALSDNGIAYTQVLTFETNDRLYYLTTSLHHKNQFISSVTPLIIGEMAGNQQFGSALTYMKRYSLAALVGVAADEDDDGNAADGNEVQAMQQAINKSPTPPAPDPIEPKKVQKTQKVDEPTPAPDIHRINVPLLPDESGSDWMTWGREFIGVARTMETLFQLNELEKVNEAPLKNMELGAPRMFTNLSMSLIKIRKELEKQK